jgi:lipopolysaccharide/colanic/teichoic acid biosynthesis glycosyltransferase
MQGAIHPAVNWAELPARRVYRLTKRLFDLVGATALLIVLAPAFACCALAVRLSSPGPIIFRQERIGERGKTFLFLKFRSMYVAADTAPHRDYVAAFIRGQARQDADVPLYKLGNDRRITPPGRWLRRTSLDELPQLWNIIRGEMSLVGPRPPIPYELEHYRPEQYGRLAVTPGLTGLWQVSGRSTMGTLEMLELDLAYVRIWSFWTDLMILLRTVPTLLRGHGAR